MAKTIVLSGGGTAGHINPALALAEHLQDDGYDIYFAGTPGGIESRLVPAAGIPFKAFEASGFDRAHPTSLVKGISKVLKSTKLAKRWFAEINPAAVVGFGGYVSIPVARAAEEMGIPVIVHEQNSIMGMANKYIAKKAKAVCLTYEHANDGLVTEGKVVVTGNPVRSSVIRASREEGRDYLRIPQDAEVLLVFGGSLGARHINQAIAAMKKDLLSHDNLYVVHVTGPKEFDSEAELLALTEEEKKRYRLIGYEDRMDLVLAAADATVARAGATSLAEIAARAVPAILVPYPFATGDHQSLNAAAYAASGAAAIIADSDVETDKFRDAVMELVEDESVRKQMHDAAAYMEAHDSAAKLTEVVESVIS